MRLFQQLWYGGNNTKLATVHRDYAVVFILSIARIVVVVVLRLILFLLFVIDLVLLVLFLLVLVFSCYYYTSCFLVFFIIIPRTEGED